MKRKEVDEQTTVKGYYIKDFIRGFLGEKGEGLDMLERMGLGDRQLPFSAAKLLSNGYARWNDCQGNTATISYRIRPNQIECFGTYLDKKKSLRLFTEWGAREDPDVIARLESEAIGDLCMRCIYENLK